MINDTISDMLTRIRNASGREKAEVEMPHANVIEGIAKVMKESGYIEDYKVFKLKGSKLKGLNIILKYDDECKPAFEKLQRFSKPGLRRYTKANDIKPVLSGLGMYIVSTPRGIMSGMEAKNKKLGGELICKIY